MSKSFSRWRSPQGIVRIVLGVLLLANLVAAALVLFPPGGSSDDLRRQLTTLRAQNTSSMAALERTRRHAAAVEQGRQDGDRFMGDNFISNRVAFSTLLAQLEAAAAQTKIKQRDRAFSSEPIEGSDSLSMMSITAAYEGTYSDLLHFVHEIDRAPRLLIIESLTAAPQQGSNQLAINMKLDTFVREGAGQTQ
jgi:Tfp pilus assembly protein PilO